MKNSWFINAKNRIHGPIDSECLQQLAGSGKIVRNTKISKTKEGPWYSADRVKGLNFYTSQNNPNPRREEPLKGKPTVVDGRLDSQPTHKKEFVKDMRRMYSAVSSEHDKFELVEPYLMQYERPVAIAVQRQFPFSIFADIVLLSSHRLMTFRRFFNSITMFDVNYVDIKEVKIQQGFFTSMLTITTDDGRKCLMPGLITEQALNVYRQAQDIETKARIARRRFELEENRSQTTQLHVNNMVAGSRQENEQPVVANEFALSQHRDISTVGQEQKDPYLLGE
jgi:hypothetical protein